MELLVNTEYRAPGQQMNPDCTDCRMSQGCDWVNEMGFGRLDADIMVVSKMPNSDSYQKLIEDALSNVGIDPSRCYYTAALKCVNFDVNPGRNAVKACSKYLEDELDEVKPKWILAFGNEALQITTGHSGITKYRAKPMAKGNSTVIATVSPAAVNRNPGQKASWLADIRFFASQVLGTSAKVGRPQVFFVDTRSKFEQLQKILKQTKVLAFDIETRGVEEYQPGSSIVSLSGTGELNSGRVICWALPLSHPQSPFRKSWKQALRRLAPYLEAVPKTVAHNGKFDCRWLRHFGVRMRCTYDTMLACHLLNENELKGLKPQCTSRFGVEDWGINTKDLWLYPIRDVLIYNALDTWYDYHLYLETKAELIAQPRVLRLFKLLIMPTLELLIEAERRGIWIDTERLATNTHVAEGMRKDIEQQLMQWVPHPDSPGSSLHAASNSPWPTNSKGKQVEVNFNPSNFARWWLFEHLGMPVLATGKEKEDGSEGAPSMAEAVMLELKGGHPVIDLLMERSKWQKYCSAFLPAYREMMDDRDRVHTTFKLAGTVTGRLSSGKADAEKITARVDIRGINVQQVPRDPFIRGLFGAAPGYAFVECDFSQIELRIVAFLARERTMLHLYNTGQDIHRATASWVMGVPPDQVTKDDRKKAKAVNFGFVYGMGAKKFVMTAWEKYQLRFTLEQAQDIRRAFFDQFKGLMPWHARQRRIVAEHGRIVSPLGRVRHLPDIFSEDWKVKAEAERQAINSPVQALASDMNLLGMLETVDRFKEAGVDGHALGTVHDATLFEIRIKDLARALPMMKSTFENLPLGRKFGVQLDVPIEAGILVGKHWGDARELTEDEIYDYSPRTMGIALT
jgi:uracil-DNA glycosylase family 4